MAELEAISVINPSAEDRKRNPAVEPGVFGRRFPLPVNEPVRIGRDAAQSDISIPEDLMISGFHATLTWDGTRLTVTSKTPAPKNPVTVGGQPAPNCVIEPGKSFWIGQTKFTLHRDGEGVPPESLEMTLAQPQSAAARIDPDRVPFANPTIVLSALAEISNVLRVAPNQQVRVRHMLRVVVAALPRSDAAGFVFVPPDSTPAQPKVGIQEHHARLSGSGAVSANSGEFQKYQLAPSRRLVHRAIAEKKAVTYYWQTGVRPSADEPTLGGDATMPPVGPHGHSTPWAICAPLQDGSRSALYVTGHLNHGESPSSKAVAEEMIGYEKVVQLMAGLLEITHQSTRLGEENARLRDFVPQPIRPYMADARRAPLVMNAREMDVVVLFCDLRNFTKFLVQQNKPLDQRWREVAYHLNLMTTAINNHGGVVCRVLGDAVMGLWGWPEAPNEEANRLGAAKAADQIRSGIGWMKQLQCGVGVAAGRALVGKLGTQHLAEVDMYGTVVNLSSRLESMTKSFGVSVIVSEKIACQLAESAAGQCAARTRRLGRVRPKGLEEHPVEVHELLPDDGHSGQDWTEWDRLVGLFTDGKWSEAYHLFAEYYPDDTAAQCLMREMDRHRRQPPAGWDGAFTPRAAEDDGK